MEGLCRRSLWVSVGGLHRFLMPMILLAVCPWLLLVALATIDLVGDNREFEV